MAVDKSQARVRRMFGEIAGRYDFLNHLLSLNLDRYWRWRTVRRAPPEPGGAILDLCTGTGDLAIAYHRAANGQTPIVGADFCHEMLVLGDRKREKLGPAADLRFIEADALALPFPDGAFQLVTVAFGLRNVADTDRGLAEMARVCAPGGRVVVLEFSLPRRQPWRGMYGFYFRRVLPRIGGWVARGGSSAYSYLPESVGEFPSGQALVERMQQAGLHSIQMHPLTLGVATLYIGRK
jgi:demethylmenaquinone methyltransferase/2-methoxy-6-polyprenyl-1,4-benzoquinol methylase